MLLALNSLCEKEVEEILWNLNCQNLKFLVLGTKGASSSKWDVASCYIDRGGPTIEGYNLQDIKEIYLLPKDR